MLLYIRNLDGKIVETEISENMNIKVKAGQQFYLDSTNSEYSINLADNNTTLNLTVKINGSDVIVSFDSIVDIFTSNSNEPTLFVVVNEEVNLNQIKETLANPDFDGGQILNELKAKLDTTEDSELFVDDFASLTLAIESSAGAGDVDTEGSDFTPGTGSSNIGETDLILRDQLDFDSAGVNYIDTDGLPTAVLTLDDLTLNEGDGTGVITASLSVAPVFGAVVFTLSNGATITFNIGERTATSTPFEIQDDDVYIDPESFVVSVTGATGTASQYSSVDTSDTATVTINDTIDEVEVTLTASANASEDGGIITYTASLPTGVTANNAITVTLSVGADGELASETNTALTITIPAGQSSGTVDAIVNRDDSHKEVDKDGNPTDSLSASISTVVETNAGTEGSLENLTADKTTKITTIIDDIDTTTVTVGTASVNEDATSASVNVTLAGHVFKTGETVTVTVANGTDVTFTANGTKPSTLTITPDSDSIIEASANTAITATVASSAGVIENPSVIAGTLTVTDSIDNVFAIIVPTDSEGNILSTSVVPEGQTAYYKAVVVDENGNLVDRQEGDVTVTFTNGTATDLDYTPQVDLNVNFGEVFSSDAITDLVADNGEQYVVSIADKSDIDAPIYENIDVLQTQSTTLLTESFELRDSDGWHVEHGTENIITGDNGVLWSVNDSGLELQRGEVGGSTASDGNTHAELDPHGTGNTQITTSVTLGSHENYALTFDYKPRPGAEDSSDMKVTFGSIAVAIDSASNGDLTITSDEGAITTAILNPDTGWYEVRVSYSGLTEETAALTFEGTSNVNTLGAYIDNIELSGNDFGSSVTTTITDNDVNTIPEADPVTTMSNLDTDIIPSTVSDKVDGEIAFYKKLEIGGNDSDNGLDGTTDENDSSNPADLGGQDVETVEANLIFDITSLPNYGTLYTANGIEITNTTTLSTSDTVYWVATHEDVLSAGSIKTLGGAYDGSIESSWTSEDADVIGRNEDNGSASITYIQNDGIGVTGETGGPSSQLGYDAQSETTEKIIIDFKNPVTEGSVDITHLIGTESGGEVGIVTAYLDGNPVGTYTFSNAGGADIQLTNDNIGNGNDSDSNSGTLVLPCIVFDQLQFTAKTYVNQNGQVSDSSDYFIGEVRYKDVQDVEFEYKVIDEQGNHSPEVIVHIDVTSNTDVGDPSNTPPSTTSTNISLDEDTTYVLKVSDFGTYTDDTTSTFTKVMITTLPGNGELLLRGTAISANTEISNADIQSGKLTFKPSLHTDEDSSFKFKLSDGEIYSEVYNNTIDVKAIADAPTVSIDITKTSSENLIVKVGSTTYNISKILNEKDTYTEVSGIENSKESAASNIIINENMNSNDHLKTSSSDNIIVLNGNLESNAKIESMDGNDFIAILGDLDGVNQSNINDSDGIDTLYFNNDSTYYSWNVNSHAGNTGMDGCITQYSDKGHTSVIGNLYINNIEGIVFADGKTIGSVEKIYEYKVDITAALVDRDLSEDLSVRIEGLPEGSKIGTTVIGADGIYNLVISDDALDVTQSLTLTTTQSLSGTVLSAIAISTEDSNGDTVQAVDTAMTDATTIGTYAYNGNNFMTTSPNSNIPGSIKWNSFNEEIKVTDIGFGLDKSGKDDGIHHDETLLLDMHKTAKVATFELNVPTGEAFNGVYVLFNDAGIEIQSETVNFSYIGNQTITVNSDISFQYIAFNAHYPSDNGANDQGFYVKPVSVTYDGDISPTTLGMPTSSADGFSTAHHLLDGGEWDISGIINDTSVVDNLNMENNEINHLNIDIDELTDINDLDEMKIFGDEDDKVVLEGGNWTEDSAKSDSTFNAYTNTSINISVYIDKDIDDVTGIQ